MTRGERLVEDLREDAVWLGGERPEVLLRGPAMRSVQ